MTLQVIGTRKNDIYVQKLLIIADVVHVEVSFSESGLHQPYGKTAVLLTSNGTVLPASVGMCYLARMRPDLHYYGQTFLETALVDKTLRHTEYHIVLPLEILTTLPDKKSEPAVKVLSDIKNAISNTIEPQLLTSTFLVGERMTIADIDLALSLKDSLTHSVIDSSWLDIFPSLKRWLELILHQPVVMRHFNIIESFPSKRTTLEVRESSVDLKDQTKKKDDVSAQSIEDEIEKEKKTKKKKINPLSLLEPSPFVLDEWKREYSNCKDLRGIAMPWFWKRFDNKGWSFWYMHYEKIEGENTLGFTTANMLGGFLQRIDPDFRQYSFGVNHVIGSNGDFDIKGVWLLRGQEIPFEIKDHPSFECYTFKKLTETKPEEKQLIEDYWCDSDVVEHRPIDSTKVWK